MGRINVGRVVLGGLLAAVVLNVVDWLLYGVLLKPELAAALQALGRQAIDIQVPMFVLSDFVYSIGRGIGLVCVYAAIRPRLGAGPKTAVIAGLSVWCFVGLLHALGEAPMRLFPQRLYLIGAIVALIQYPGADVVGASAYKEVS